MTSNPVNLDALIPREDFETSFAEIATASNLGDKMRVTDLSPGSLWYTVLRKPDFQRETANWSPERIAELVSSFLEGDLIPAVILWRSTTSGNLFVIDGAHRISALIAWVHDDYGDKDASRTFFDNNIPQEQIKAGIAARALINARVGSYEDLSQALRKQDTAPEERVKLARNMSAFAVSVQWVGGGVEKAEASFFKINQQAVLINSTELDMLKARAEAECTCCARIHQSRDWPQVLVYLRRANKGGDRENRKGCLRSNLQARNRLTNPDIRSPCGRSGLFRRQHPDDFRTR